MPDGLTAYNPYDPEQAKFLAGLRAGESGGNYSIGTGGVDLSHVSTDQYGFPQWGGTGNSHAAGAYQFQPGTWKAVAAKFGLNFQNKDDQDKGAWYNAEQVYQRKTGGSLDADLDAGLYSKIQSALATEWTSVTGSGGLPQGLAAYLGNGVAAELAPGATDSSGTPSLITSPIQAITTYFVRGSMILIGGLILAVALFALLKSDILPSVTVG